MMTSVTSTLLAWAKGNTERMAGLVGLPSHRTSAAATRLPAPMWTVAITVLGAVTFTLAVAGASAVVRAPFVLGYLLIAPGWAIVRLLDVPDTAMRVSLTLGLSISIVGIVTLVQAYASSWNPSTMVLLGVLVTVAAGCIEIVRERRRSGQ